MKKKQLVKNTKGWKFPAQQPDEEEEEDPITEDKNPQAPPPSKGINQEKIVATGLHNRDAEGNLDQEIQKKKVVRGFKCSYSSQSLDSNKEHMRKTTNKQLIIVMSIPNPREW